MIDTEMFSQEATTEALVREERQKGIKILIETLLEVGMSPCGVSRKVVSKYDLPEEAKGEIEQIAQEMFNQKVTAALVREERIKGTVEGLLEMNVPPSRVLQKVMSKYNLSEKDAKWYFDEVSRSMLESKSEARKEDIREAVKRFRKVNLSDEDILENIMIDYDLFEEEARKYLEESKSGSNVS